MYYTYKKAKFNIINQKEKDVDDDERKKKNSFSN